VDQHASLKIPELDRRVHAARRHPASVWCHHDVVSRQMCELARRSQGPRA
jgi:hypothetical protein